MRKNILITGGSGFIGSNLVDFLLSKGHNIFVIDDLSTGLKENENSLATYYHYDLVNCIEDSKYIEDILINHNIDFVYHLAASADIFLSINNPEKVYKINVLASIAFVNVCIKCNIKKFLFASTSAVYGEPQYLPVDEQHPTDPMSPYGLTKLGFEQYLSYLKLHSDTSFIIYRFPNVYGYRQRPDLEGGVVAIFQDAIEKNNDIKIFGDGRQTRDWVDVVDILSALDKGLGFEKKFDIFSLGSNTKTSLTMLLDYFKDITGYSKSPIYLDERDGDIKHMVMRYDYAKKELDWEPSISLRDGIRKLVDGVK
ncbi:MAG: NAD-dependent epimerase/dehydratase family protein [Pseudomonadota bacterium]|nr:UDP-glucose 4-epimerase [Gammaproteobacteria bacterium]MEE2684466.1 NAD-dependent epimerase/dehydratase family protein [Pseudomonadota bacterium]|tara:strand:+ start:896 stop:1828 length:933 start_codon:yes stop_codon:yes gene_type:complete